MDELTTLNTLGLSSCCRLLIQAKNLEDVKSAYRIAASKDLPVVVLGGGSNVVLAEQIEAVFLQPVMAELSLYKEEVEQVVVRVEAGYEWHQFVLTCLEQHWHGIENMALIPGNVGASPVQNIGAYGVEVADVFEQLEAYDIESGDVVTLDKEACSFAYRDSLFKNEGAGKYVILAVYLRLNKTFQPNLSYGPLAKAFAEKDELTAQKLVDKVIEIRQSKLPDPKVLGNAGSFFKNPVVSSDRYHQLKQAFPELVAYPQNQSFKLAAGWLIDQAGLKGYRQGPVGMHQLQALVLVNYGGASRSDVISLMQHVINTVQTKFGVLLEHEPVFVPPRHN